MGQILKNFLEVVLENPEMNQKEVLINYFLKRKIKIHDIKMG